MHPPVLRTALVAVLLAALGACSSNDGSDRSEVDALPTTPSVTPEGTATQPPTTTITPSPAPIITVPGTPTPTVTSTGAPSATPPVVTEAPEDPLTPKPPLETAPPTGQPLCDSKDLTVTDADALIDRTAVRELFVVRTTGPDCQLQGYPTVVLKDAAGKVLPATYRPGGFGLPAERPTAHTLSTGTSISFIVASARSGTSCVEAATATVRLPGTTAALTTTTAFSVCDRAVGLSPVRRQLDIE